MLPVQTHLPTIVGLVKEHRRLVLTAEPGAGKTSLVPWALTEALCARHDGQKLPDQVWVSEPRRLAARLAAVWASEALGEPVGLSVGFRHRQSVQVGPHTRLVFMTEGVLQQALAQGALPPYVRAVIFDEFHARSLASDVSLARLRHEGLANKDGPALVVMSATLDAQNVADYLGSAPIVHVSGRQHAVTISYLPANKDVRLPQQVARAVRQIMTDPDLTTGDILVFLPGVKDIADVQLALAASDLNCVFAIYALHGRLSVEAQYQAVTPKDTRKIILATNVAESAVTVSGVRFVIDSGLAHVTQIDAHSGLPCLMRRPISQAACHQRAGRAGREQPGKCLRLFSQQSFLRREAFEAPEIVRADLSEAELHLLAQNLPPLSDLVCLTPPPVSATRDAHQLLKRLGATHADRITPMGRLMARLALPPRLSRLVLAAKQAGHVRAGCKAAALLAHDSQSIFALAPGLGLNPAQSDVYALKLADRDMPQESAFVMRQLVRQAQALVVPPCLKQRDEDEALAWALMHAFCDRVAKRLAPLGAIPGALPLAMCDGQVAYLSANSRARFSTFVVALSVRRQTGTTQAKTLVAAAAEISAEWLLDLTHAEIQEHHKLFFNAPKTRVMMTTSVCYMALSLEDTPCVVGAPAALAQPLIADHLRATGALVLAGKEVWPQLRARLQYLAHQHATWGLPATTEALDDMLVKSAIALCAETNTVLPTHQGAALQHMLAHLPPKVHDALSTQAPSHLVLCNKQRFAIDYQSTKAPHIGGYIQDFFGVAESPHLDGKTIVLHLQAPNKRDVQVTSDLPHFWQIHYPPLRKALSRRYPRFFWPEAPQEARPMRHMFRR